MAGKVKGITVKLGGDTTGLNKAIKSTNREIGHTQTELRKVERLLKMDPKNTELLAQKQKLLTQAIAESKEKVEALKAAKAAADQQMKSGTEINQNQYRALEREISATEQQLNNLEDAARKSNVTLQQIGQTAGQVAEGAGKMAKLTAGMSAAAGGALVAAGKTAITYEDDFAKLSTLLDDATTDYDAYKKSVLDGAKDMSVAPKEYTEAVYSAISASVDQAAAVEFTSKAAKLAKGGFTELTKAVDIQTTVLNGYGKAVEETDHISDVLITTQNEGKTTVDELASSMGAAIPVAANANFSFEELAAGYALMTKNGIATAESGTYLKSMLSELTKAGSTSDKALRKLSGKGFADLRAEGKPTAEILNMLSDYAERNGKTLKDMFGSVEGGSAALMLARNDGADFTEMLDTMCNSAGATDDAYNKVADTAGAKLKKSLNDVRISAISLGDTMAPLIEKLVEWVGQLTEKLAGMDQGQLQTMAVVLLLVAALSPLLAMISQLATAIQFVTTVVIPGISAAMSFLAANPIVLLITAIVALVALIAVKGDEIQALLQKLDDFLQSVFVTDWTTVFGPVLGNVLNGFFQIVKDVWDSVKSIFDGIIDFVRGVFTGDWERAWRGVSEIFDGIFGGLEALAKAPLNGLIGLLNGAIGAINSLVNGFNSIGFTMPKWLGGGSWHPNLPNIPNIPYLAKGGILSQGSAVVGEAGPELLTMNHGRAVVQPLAHNSTTTTNLGGVNITVYGAPGQDVRQLADVLMEEFESVTARKAAVF